jgi:hypothetical protein
MITTGIVVFLSVALILVKLARRLMLRAACQHALEHLAPPERARLWLTLGVLALDDRPGVGVRNGVPDIS